MLARFSTGTQVSVSVAGNKVALSLQGLRRQQNLEKRIFRAALCRVVYLFCARAVQPPRTWATLSGALLHSLHITSPIVSVCVFWLAYNLVG